MALSLSYEIEGLQIHTVAEKDTVKKLHYVLDKKTKEIWRPDYFKSNQMAVIRLEAIQLPLIDALKKATNRRYKKRKRTFFFI